MVKSGVQGFLESFLMIETRFLIGALFYGLCKIYKIKGMGAFQKIKVLFRSFASFFRSVAILKVVMFFDHDF